VRMLHDPIVSVRTEAARILSRSPQTLFEESDYKLFRVVFQELKKRFEYNLDRPESHLSLGILAENQNDPILPRNITVLQLSVKVPMCPPE